MVGLPTSLVTLLIPCAWLAGVGNAFADDELPRSQSMYYANINGQSTGATIINAMTPLSTSQRYDVGANHDAASSFVDAQLGSLKVDVSAAATGLRQIASGQGLAEVSDGLTFDSAGLGGQYGYTTITLLYNASRALAANGPRENISGNQTFASLVDNIGLSLGTSTTVDDRLRFGSASISETIAAVCNTTGCVDTASQSRNVYVDHGALVLSDIPNQSLTLRMPIKFGVELLLSMSINASLAAHSGLDGVASGVYDAAHSVYWGGIASVVDSAGNPVDFTVQSVSGADYTRSFAAAVPEASTPLMLASGLLLLGALASCRTKGVRAKK